MTYMDPPQRLLNTPGSLVIVAGPSQMFCVLSPGLKNIGTFCLEERKEKNSYSGS